MKLKVFISFMMVSFASCAYAQWNWLPNRPSGASILICLANDSSKPSQKLFLGWPNGLDYSLDGGNSWTLSDSGLKEANINVGYGERSFLTLKNVLFAGTEANGLFRSANDGISWNSVNTIPSNAEVFALGVSNTSSPSKLLFASAIFERGYDSIYISTDLGFTWSNSGFPGYPIVNSFASVQTDSGIPVLFVGTNKGVLTSTDEGTTWVSSNTGLPSGVIVQCFAALDTIASSPLVLAGTNAGVWVSKNAGKSWELPTLDSLSINNLVFTGTDLFAATDSGVSLSFDSGRTWKNVSDSLPQTDSTYANYGYFAFTLSGGNLFVIGEGGDQLGDEIFSLFRRPLSDFAQAGITEREPLLSGLRLFPNPALNELQILPGPSGTARLFDVLGREVLDANDDGTGTTLDVSHLEAGTYFLRTGTQSAKIVVAH